MLSLRKLNTWRLRQFLQAITETFQNQDAKLQQHKLKAINK